MLEITPLTRSTDTITKMKTHLLFSLLLASSTCAATHTDERTQDLQEKPAKPSTEDAPTFPERAKLVFQKDEEDITKAVQAPPEVAQSIAQKAIAKLEAIETEALSSLEAIHKRSGSPLSLKEWTSILADYPKKLAALLEQLRFSALKSASEKKKEALHAQVLESLRISREELAKASELLRIAQDARSRFDDKSPEPPPEPKPETKATAPSDHSTMTPEPRHATWRSFLRALNQRRPRLR